MPEDSDSLTLQEVRSQELSKIDQDIEYAFDHRSKLSEESLESVEELNSDIREGLKKGIQKENVTVNLVPEKAENIVSTENSHMYPALISKTFYKAIDELHANVPDGWVEAQVHSMLEHEYMHAVPALQQEGLKIDYRVKIIDDDINGGISIRPSIGINGKVDLPLYQDIATNPDQATYSESDKKMADLD